MYYTQFGEMMRILRVKKHESLRKAAAEMHLSKSFMSEVERGEKNVPESWIDIISGHYKLDDDEKDRLIQAIDRSRKQVKISLSGASEAKRDLIFEIEERFDEIDDSTAQRILAILRE